MAEKKPTEGIDIAVDIYVTSNIIPQPGNHFAVSYTNDDFALDIAYIHPFDLHLARQKPEAERRVRGNVVARIALNYRGAVELRAKLDEMINSYEEHKK